MIDKSSNKNFNFPRWAAVFFLCLLIAGLNVRSAFSQYSGGSQTGSASSTLGSDIYTGGAQSGTTAANSSSESLSHGTATKLIFTVSPSSAKHYKKFERQPVVVVQDADGNVVTVSEAGEVGIVIGGKISVGLVKVQQALVEADGLQNG